MATPLDLTRAHRSLQAKRAGLVAALVARYFQTRVNVDDPASVERWLELMVPRILAQRDAGSSLAASYANELRRLEVPSVKDGFTYEKASTLQPEVVRASLSIVGSDALAKRYRDIRTGEDGEIPDPVARQALIEDANRDAATRIAGAVARHVQNGSRQTLLDGVHADKVALGYTRVTKDNPCYFCALLSSRGLVYDQDSFDESDARFTNGKVPGTIKVHDHCACSLKPTYTTDDEALAQSREFFKFWRAAQRASDKKTSAVVAFRQLYEGRLSTD